MFFQSTFDLIRRVFGRPNTAHTSSGTNAGHQDVTTIAGRNEFGRLSSIRRGSYSRNRQGLFATGNAFFRDYGELKGTSRDGVHTSLITTPSQNRPIEGDTSKKRKADRDLMPPPTLTDHPSPPTTCKRPKRESLGTPDSFNEARSQRAKPSEIENEYDMRAARRKAAATQLPPNSGTWEPAERELFFHLSYRGFEPLLPKNWMIDFPTLPISLFATQKDQTPLIECHRSTEFRAIKALRELIDTGKTVRDRVLSTGPVLRSEPIVERATKKYIKWGMRDIGISHRQCIPVHAIVAMKQGHSMADTIRELTISMHKLSARHREACNVLTSIERERAGCCGDDQQYETRLHDRLADTEHKLPVIYGLMVCSSLLAVFTLNSYTPPPRFVDSACSAGCTVEASGGENDKDDENEDSGLRFLSSFDFSNSTSDVWNAFVIAIVAMMIRKTLLDVYDIPAVDNELDYDESVLDSSLVDGDVECGRNRYIARYAANKNEEFIRNKANLGYDDTHDPDL